MDNEILTEENFLLYVAKKYNAAYCRSTEEFLEDLNRLKYIKKLITRFIEKNDLQERLILNHIIILNNVFGPYVTAKLLYFKMKHEMTYIKPFLVLLDILPKNLYNIKTDKIINTDEIALKTIIVNSLRKIKNDEAN